MDNRDIYEYGWGLKGQRIYGQRPGKKRERISIMSGYSLFTVFYAIMGYKP
jgi:hypothetical protein